MNQIELVEAGDWELPLLHLEPPLAAFRAGKPGRPQVDPEPA
jgi:hypothetical protein